MNDSVLIEEIKMGNSEAYRQLFVRFYSPLCEYASQFLSDVDSEELVQELMLYIWETREYLIIESSLKSYLFIAVRNRSYNAIRNQQYRKKVHSALYEKIKEQFEDPDYYLVEELASKIQKAIEDLPESYRETFQMSRFGELTNIQIAAKIGVSVKTVEYRITKSLKILRVKLKKYIMLISFL